MTSEHTKVQAMIFPLGRRQFLAQNVVRVRLPLSNAVLLGKPGQPWGLSGHLKSSLEEHRLTNGSRKNRTELSQLEVKIIVQTDTALQNQTTSMDFQATRATSESAFDHDQDGREQLNVVSEVSSSQHLSVGAQNTESVHLEQPMAEVMQRKQISAPSPSQDERAEFCRNVA